MYHQWPMTIFFMSLLVQIKRESKSKNPDDDGANEATIDIEILKIYWENSMKFASLKKEISPDLQSWLIAIK